MLIGRHSSLSGATRAQLSRRGAARDRAPRDRSRLLRAIAYSLLGLLGLSVVLTVGLALLGQHRPPPRMVQGNLPAPPAPAATPPAASPAASPDMGQPSSPDTPGSDAAAPASRLKAVRTQVESETTVLAALRDQAEQARQELADLQQQQQAARAAIADLQNQQRAARSALADLQKQQVQQKQAAPPKPEPPREKQVAKAAPPPAPPPPDNKVLERILQRLRQPGTAEQADAAPALRSPPPAMLGQIPASTVPDARAESGAGSDAGVETAARRRVFLNYRAGSTDGAAEASDLARRLLFSDFAYAETRTVAQGGNAPLIRYFHRQDAGAAQRLADLLRGSGIDFRVQDASGAQGRAAPGTIEVWIPS